jgi:hypothetical protein
VQVKPELGTSLLDAGGLNVQFAVSTRVSQRPNSPLAGVWFWNSLIVDDVNATSLMSSVQFGVSQPGAPGLASPAGPSWTTS